MQGSMVCAALAMLVAAAAAPAKARAQSLPPWRIADICAHESAPGQCAAFEGRALKAVSASWPFVLDPIKKACLEQAKNPLDRSWRLLSECLDDATRKALDNIAVHTARTPAEPVPPPKPPAPPALPAAAAPATTATPGPAPTPPAPASPSAAPPPAATVTPPTAPAAPPASPAPEAPKQ
jgi:hypothetical protein